LRCKGKAAEAMRKFLVPGLRLEAPARRADGREAGAAHSPVGLSLPLALGLLGYVMALGSANARLDDPDTMLHVVVGRWILAHHAVPHADFLTYSVPGRPWVVHEWLGGVVSALFYDALGWHGLVAMAGLGFGAAIAIFARALMRYYMPAQAVVIACAAWLVVLPHWLARPHIVALPFLVAWTALLVAARVDNRAPRLGWALLMIAWVNIHGTFLVGIGFCGLFAVEAVLVAPNEAARLEAARQWALFTLAAVACSLVTPNGIEAYLLPLRLLDMKFALSLLQEWKSINFQTLTTYELWLLLFIGVALYRGIKLPVSRVLLVLLLFAMSLQHARNGDLLAIIAPLLAGPFAGPQLARAPAREREDWLARCARPANAAGFALGAAVIVAAEAVALSFPLGPVEKYAPAAAVRAVAAAGIEGPVLNDYNFGDYLMFVGIKTFIDGRADMFGDPFIKRYYEATHGQGNELPQYLARYKVAWTLFAPDADAVKLMDHMTGWHRFYADKLAVVHVRDGTAPASIR
jgi:hypothetical protein